LHAKLAHQNCHRGESNLRPRSRLQGPKPTPLGNPCGLGEYRVAVASNQIM